MFEAIDALREATRLNPEDRQAKELLDQLLSVDEP